MLLFTRTSILLLSVPVLSVVTPAKTLAEKRGPADDSIPRVLTQVQSTLAIDKGIPSWNIMDDFLSSDIPSADGSYHLPSVKTQYDLIFPKNFPC